MLDTLSRDEPTGVVAHENVPHLATETTRYMVGGGVYGRT